MTHNKKTYCNPLSLSDFSIMRFPDRSPSATTYRQIADPTCLYLNGKWYLYTSLCELYESDDFINWKHYRIEGIPPKQGAPTVLYYRERFYYMDNWSEVYVSDAPEGPFSPLGPMKDLRKEAVWYADNMLFADDDGRVYYYYGSGPNGIYGAELAGNDPTQMITEPKQLVRYSPDETWMNFGGDNQNTKLSWLEGGWMYKHNGVYYLTFCACGTEFPTYVYAAYKGASPLGDFEPMKTNPLLLKREGLVNGVGHGSICDGPNGTHWIFYTELIGYATPFERAVGMDPIGIDENGDLYCPEVSERPQFAPGYYRMPEKGNGTGWHNLSFRMKTYATSSAEGRDAIYATDGGTLSFWLSADGDEKSCLSVDLQESYTVSGIRVWFRDVGLDLSRGIVQKPIAYRVEADTKNGRVTLIDRSKPEDETLIEYTELDEKVRDVTHVHLTVLGTGDETLKAGVIDFSVFGYMED